MVQFEVHPLQRNDEVYKTCIAEAVDHRWITNSGDGLFHIARHEGDQVAARTLDAFDPEAEYESGAMSELAEQRPIV